MHWHTSRGLRPLLWVGGVSMTIACLSAYGMLRGGRPLEKRLVRWFAFANAFALTGTGLRSLHLAADYPRGRWLGAVAVIVFGLFLLIATWCLGLIARRDYSAFWKYRRHGGDAAEQAVARDGPAAGTS
jgi:ABC-type transport system involved in cytochrome c biogenesis permease subunit